MDPYQELGLTSDATKDQVKQRYRELAKKFHPDRFRKKSESERATAEEKFKKIQEAYQIIVEGPRQSQESRNFYQQTTQDFNFSSFEDLISNFFGFGGGFSSQRQVMRLSVNLTDTLIEGRNVLKLNIMGKQVTLTLPIGVQTGQVMQVPGLKEVYVNLLVKNDKDFFRVGSELIFVALVSNGSFKCLSHQIKLLSDK